jgi:hypothetical protein
LIVAIHLSSARFGIGGWSATGASSKSQDATDLHDPMSLPASSWNPGRSDRLRRTPHAPSNADLIPICHGSTDIAAGIRLRLPAGDAPGSGLGRTGTALPVFQRPAPGQHRPVFVARFDQPLADARLREVDFGRWDGRRWDEIVKQDAQRHAHWLEAVIRSSDGGVSLTCCVAPARLAALLGSTGRDDCACTRPSGSIRALLCHALGLPPGRAMAIGIDEARVSRLRYGNGQFEVRYINTTRFERD